MLKVAVIGFGMIGKHYCSAVEAHGNCNLSYIVDIDVSKFNQMKQQFPNSILVDSYTLIPKEIDIVCIATPNITHYEIAKRCLENDIHVLCEKPSTTTLTDTQLLITCANRRNRIFKTAYHRSYNKHVQEVLGSIDINSIEYITCRYCEDIREHVALNRIYNKCEVGGGCIIDNGINVFDVIYKFLGDFTIEDKVIVTDTMFHEGEYIDVSCVLKGINSKNIPITIELDRRFPGEEKTMTIGLTTGKTVCIDMLKGYTEFKSSLTHEYIAIIDEICSLVNNLEIEEDRATLHHMKLIEEIYTA